jgi:tRNA nucleotidyltransferase (CCA-adding enzyme)
MLDCRHLIKNISCERIFTELSKMLCGKNVKKVLIEFSEILGEVIPETNRMKGFEQHNFHHIYDVLTHTAVVVENAPPLFHLRLAALFHDIGKPFCFSLDETGTGHFYSHASKSALIAERCLDELRCDNKTKESVIRLVKLHDTPIEESERIIKRRLNSMGSELFYDLIKLKRADTAGLAPEFAERNEHFDRLCRLPGKAYRRARWQLRSFHPLP